MFVAALAMGRRVEYGRQRVPGMVPWYHMRYDTSQFHLERVAGLGRRNRAMGHSIARAAVGVGYHHYTVNDEECNRGTSSGQLVQSA